MGNPEFEAEVDKTVDIYESLIAGYASNTRNMIKRLGYIGALSRLVVSADLQKGFKILRDRDELCKTFESIVVKFKELFDPKVVEAAEWRLDNPNDLLS